MTSEKKQKEVKPKQIDFKFDSAKIVDQKEIERYEQEMLEQAKQQRKIMLQSHYVSVSSGVNARYWHESLDTYIPETEEEKSNLQKIKTYVSVPHQYKMLLLLGNYGTGKTHLGCSIIREMGGKYITSLKLCIEYEMGGNFNAQENKLQILEKYSKMSVLVIDEIGRGLKEQTEKEILAYILNERYEKMLPTILISNIQYKDLVSFFGQAIFDRMTEIAICLNFTGKSKRSEKLKYSKNNLTK